MLLVDLRTIRRRLDLRLPGILGSLGVMTSMPMWLVSRLLKTPLTQSTAAKPVAVEHPYGSRCPFLAGTVITNASDGSRFRFRPNPPPGYAGLLPLGSAMTFDGEDYSPIRMKVEAEALLRQYYAETEEDTTVVRMPLDDRIEAVKLAIDATGAYEQTADEVAWAAQVGWRNASRCSYRNNWDTLQVVDARNCGSATAVMDRCMEYLRQGTNGGAIVPQALVFAAKARGQRGPRIWNDQFVRYAGYDRQQLAAFGILPPADTEGLEQARHIFRPEDERFGNIIGDPSQVQFTTTCLQLGWRPTGGRAGWFDVLPVVVEWDGEVVWRALEEGDVLEVPIGLLREYGVKWHGLVSISSLVLEAGGLFYTACPLTAWYYAFEVVRNLTDPQRYNLLPLLRSVVRDHAGLPLSDDSLMVLLNADILASFQAAGVTMRDHHALDALVTSFIRDEMETRGYVAADWVFLNPPLPSSAGHVFHQEMVNIALKPSYLRFDTPSYSSTTP